MTDRKTDDRETGDRENGLALDYQIDEPPHKVWRAITTPALRESWLPTEALADPEAASVTPGEEVSYRMRESSPPFLESLVTFRISINDAGGTSLRIIHELADAQIDRMIKAAANSNGSPLMLAA